MEKNDTVKIILIDDDKDDCDIFEKALENTKSNVELSFFHDGLSALEYLNDDNAELPDILFLDINMPLISGLELLKLMRANKRLQDLPIAIYSTSSLQEHIEEALIHGANIYLVKPNSIEVLEKSLQNVIKIHWQIHSGSVNLSTFLYTCWLIKHHSLSSINLFCVKWYILT